MTVTSHGPYRRPVAAHMMCAAIACARACTVGEYVLQQSTPPVQVPAQPQEETVQPHGAMPATLLVDHPGGPVSGLASRVRVHVHPHGSRAARVVVRVVVHW
jgi:hypothetical protein